MIYPRFFSLSILAALLYFCFSVLMLNSSLLAHAFFSFSPLAFLQLTVSLLISSYGAFQPINFFLLLTTSLLVGGNIFVSLLLLQRVKKMGNVQYSFGGASIIGVFSSGCASCGFSALSLFGISGTVGFIPFHETGLYSIAIVLLLTTLFYSIKQLQAPLVCKK